MRRQEQKQVAGNTNFDRCSSNYAVRFDSGHCRRRLLLACGDGKRNSGPGALPDGVPFASAATAGWPNVLVVAELLFASINHVSPGMLLVAQVLAITIALSLVSLDARRLGAGDTEVAAALLGDARSPPRFGRSARPDGFAGALRPSYCATQGGKPGAFLKDLAGGAALCRLGKSPWAVLVGLAVAGMYLVFSRLRLAPGVAISVGLASLSAIHVNPAGLATWRYYAGVLSNEAAQRHSDLWARPSLESGFDILLCHRPRAHPIGDPQPSTALGVGGNPWSCGRHGPNCTKRLVASPVLCCSCRRWFDVTAAIQGGTPSEDFCQVAHCSAQPWSVHSYCS